MNPQISPMTQIQICEICEICGFRVFHSSLGVVTPL